MKREREREREREGVKEDDEAIKEDQGVEQTWPELHTTHD